MINIRALHEDGQDIWPKRVGILYNKIYEHTMKMTRIYGRNIRFTTSTNTIYYQRHSNTQKRSFSEYRDLFFVSREDKLFSDSVAYCRSLGRG